MHIPIWDIWSDVQTRVGTPHKRCLRSRRGGGDTAHSNLDYLVRFQTRVGGGTPHKVLEQLGWGQCSTLIGLKYQSRLMVGWLAGSVSDYITSLWLPFAS